MFKRGIFIKVVSIQCYLYIFSMENLDIMFKMGLYNNVLSMQCYLFSAWRA